MPKLTKEQIGNLRNAADTVSPDGDVSIAVGGVRLILAHIDEAEREHNRLATKVERMKAALKWLYNHNIGDDAARYDRRQRIIAALADEPANPIHEAERKVVEAAKQAYATHTVAYNSIYWPLMEAVKELKRLEGGDPE